MSKQIDEVETDNIRAIAIDTNVFRNGRYSRRQLETLAREARAVSVELWLPEVVVWELAAHAADDYEEVHQLTGAIKRLAAAGLEVSLEGFSLSRDEVIDHVIDDISQFGAPVRIIPASEGAALEGLKDQVLQRIQGEVQSGVRTGAADGAWLRDVIGAANPPDSVVVVSDDAGIEKRLDTWAFEPLPLVKRWHHLRPSLFKYMQAPAAAAESIVRFARAAIEEKAWAERLDLDKVGIADLTHRWEHGYWAISEPVDIQAEMEDVEAVVGIARVQIDNRRATASAVLWIVGDVSVTAWFANQLGEGIVAIPERARHQVVRVPAVVQFDAAGGVETVAVEAEPDVRPDVTHYTDEDEALLSVLEAFDLVPHVDDLVEDWQDMRLELADEETHSWSLPRDRELTVFLSEDPGEGWRLEVQVDPPGMKDRLVVVCEFDTDAYYMREPEYEVRVEEGLTRVSTNPSWAPAEYLLRTLIP